MSKTYQFKTKERMKKGIEIMKKTLAIILSVLMVVCMMPSMAFAEGDALSESNVTLEPTEMLYTGLQLKPVVNISEDTRDHYSITYGENINAVDNQTNEGSVTITAKEGAKYTGTYTVHFDIQPKSISSAIPGFMYNFAVGDEITANQIVLKDGNRTIKTQDYEFGSNMTISNDKYTLQSGDNIITLKGKNNYKDSVEVHIKGAKKISDCTITLTPSDSTNFVYDGKAKVFSTVSVKDGNNTLTENIDYMLNYSNNVNASVNGKTAKLEIVGMRDYGGSKEYAYSISPRPINNAYIETIENQSLYATPLPVVKDTGLTGSPTLKNEVDYTLKYENNSSVGTARVKILGQNNYTGVAYKNFEIKDSIPYSAVTYTLTGYDYTGSVIKPLITVRDSTRTYVENRDYKVVNGNNINAGTYTFKLVGIGNYGGEFYTGTYTIREKPFLTIDTTLTLASDSVYYNGKVQTPAVTVRCAGRILTKDVDYTVSYYNNTKIGTATVYIYGKGNYSGSLSKTFKILGKDISSANASLSQTSYNYDGLAKKPTVTMYDGVTRLSSGVDYSVDYKNNTNSGTASAIITGKGNYSGTKTLTFQIVGKDQTLTTNKTYYTKYLTSEPFNLQAKKDGDGTIVYTSSDTSVAKVSSTGTITICGTGEAVIKVETTGNIKYNPTSKNVYITVKPKTPNTTVTTPSRGRIKVKIKKVDGTTKYQVKYGFGGKYKNKYLTHRDNEYTTISTIIKNCKSGKLYYVKVRAYKTAADGTKVYGNWAVKKIRVRW